MTRPIRIALYALAAVLMLPAVVGLVDAWCWTLLGHQATGIEWGERGGVAWFMTVAAIMVVLPVLIE